MSEHQITMVSLDELVSTDHQYRRFKTKIQHCIH
ncbi:MAG: hypothetical protein PG979_000560 [Rickettsia asembonensis]|nr:MAG: hypothetical protein PG979_000560 [Rickettsia asembonensis]